MKHAGSRAKLGGSGRVNGGPLIPEIYDTLFSAFGPQHWWPGETREEVIVGAILTQNTSWANVERAIHQLKQRGLLSFPALRDISTEKLAVCIRPAGTFRVKARRLKALVEWLFETYSGDLDAMFASAPTELREQLLGVSGIGPETADAVMLYAGDLPTFVVDAYTQRISRRHFIMEAGATYDETQRAFESQLPRDPKVFGEYHALLVALGKQYCRPRARCECCPLRDFAHDADR